MKRIFKFRMPVGEDIQVRWHRDIHIIHVGAQGEMPDAVYVWAETPEYDPDLMQKRRFICLATGQQVDDLPMTYIGTAVYSRAGLVWHLYEVHV